MFSTSMRYAHFVVNNHSSLDYGIKITYPFNLSHSTVDISATTIPGHSGDLLTNNHRYNNFTQTINILVQKPPRYTTWSQLAIDINNWLIADKYQLFYFSNLGDWVLEGYLAQALTLEPQDDLQAIGTISLNCKPYMKRKDGLIFVPITTNTKIFNSEKESAEPILHVVGKGNIKIAINGNSYYLNNVADEIFIDSEQEWIYHHKFDENMAMHAIFPNNDFPKLLPGNNDISISGKYTKFEYKANWRRLA